MTLFKLFPIPVYKFSLAGHETYKNKLIEPIVKKYTDNPNSICDWARHCDSWQVGVDDLGLDLKDLYVEIMEGCRKYLTEVQASGTFKIIESWFNVHTSDMYQEVHNHIPAFISGTYYIQFDKDKDNSLTFVSNNTDSVDLKQLDVDEGDVILFPSTLRHMVNKAKEPHDNLRITNSFNIR